jgi:hypothetical protein
MITISILSIILVISVIFCSLCRIPSRNYRHIYSKSVIFVHPEDAKHFGDLFSIGDVESIHRIMKALPNRKNIEIIEMDEEIYIINHNPASVENFRRVPRGLFVSDYDPIEDLCYLRSFHIGFRHITPDAGKYVISHKSVSVTEFKEVTDDLFISDFDILETLKNLSPQTPFIPASQAS